ncbi:FGGY-family carbohydrate kinase [Mycoplasmatota bacterium]|nr:FGGY-family carbohydrate kinase [Mycoplasmatota bacterium]
MNGKYILGIDIGTYSSKGVLIDTFGKLIASKVVEHDIIIPQKGWVEHDAEETWWGGFTKISNALIEESGVDPNEIASVGCSAIGPCLLPVDEGCNPLRNGILYGIDTRSTEEIAYLEEKYTKEQIFNKCGNSLSTQAIGPKILWLKNNEPDIYEKAYKFITSTTFIVARLTGNYVIDHYSASSFQPMYDFKSNKWSKEMSKLITPISKLADIRWTTDIAGTITKEASKSTGLSVGTPVIVGTIDASAEAVSVGVVNPGSLMLMYGTTQFMINITDKPVTDERLWSAPYLFPNTYAVMGGMATSGAITVWFMNNFAKDLILDEKTSGIHPLESMASDLSKIPPGSEGLLVLPYFSGERTPINNPNAKGIIYGLSLIHTREHIYRAILEGIGFAISQHMDVFESARIETKVIRSVGGGTKNKDWLQIVSDISGYEQEVPDISIGASFGDALLAGIGTGHIVSRSDINHWIKKIEKIVPDSKKTSKYKEIKHQFHELYYSTKELMNKKEIK